MEKMNKTKICCLNIEQEICDELSENFDVYNGSLGKNVNVAQNNKIYSRTFLLPKYNFPPNIQEYEIFISDLANNKTIEYHENEHQKEKIVGCHDMYFFSQPPETLFNPIPFSCNKLEQLLREKNMQRPIINILFQHNKTVFEYTVVDKANPYLVNEKISCCNYSYTMNCTNKALYGKEVQICDDKIAKILFEGLTDEIEYHQTFRHPTKWYDDAEESIPDKNFLPLLKNKNGQIVSYMWISDYEIAFMLPQLKSKKTLLDRLFKEVLFQYFSEFFPEIETISWKNKTQYYLPKQQELENKKQDITKKYNEDIAKIEEVIEENSKKHAFLHDILTGTGDILVESIIEYLKWLGFEHAIEKDKTAANGLLEEDIQVDLEDNSLLIIEVKGINGTSKDSECSQISKIRHRRCKERKSFDVFALYIANNERNIEPLKRTIPPFNNNQIQDAINDDRGLMYTWQLFNLFFNVENGFISKEEARNCFLQTGLVDFTPTLKELGKPYKFYQNHTVICVELYNNTIHVGDTLAYEKDGRYYPITIIEIQQNEKPVIEVSDGKVGIKVDEKVPEIKTLYFVKRKGSSC
ncbi:MAG: hypothetical protein IJT61_04860 [Bacteroidales bacterium]|nr:hypothetical protein [Bacteroidales bacterium]